MYYINTDIYNAKTLHSGNNCFGLPVSITFSFMLTAWQMYASEHSE